MTTAQEDHIKQLQKTFCEMLDDKYRAGAEEHPGDIRDMSLQDAIDNAILENIDQFTYLMVAREKARGVVIPGGHHTPNRKRVGSDGVECWLCWNQGERSTCVLSNVVKK